MRLTLLAAAALLSLLPAAANAAVDIYVSDNGTDTLVQVAGSLDLSGFTRITPNGTEPGSDMIQGFGGILYTGDPRQGLQAYTGLTNGNSFGGFGTSFANSGTGTGFGINGAYTPPRLLLARTYASGDRIDSTATYLYRTIDSLGLLRGDYRYASASDTITLHVGQSAPAVPEPATWGMTILGVGMIGVAARRRRYGAAAMRTA